MTERQGFQPEQPRQSGLISLTDYRGILSDRLEVNPGVERGLRWTAGYRRKVRIVSRPPDRGLDYDQVGHVAEGKMHRRMRFRKPFEPGHYSISKEEDT